MKGIQAVLLTASLLIPSAVAGQRGPGTPEMQLKAAMQAELVDGDLRAAIEAYKAIVSRAGDNRAVVARALLQLAGCYEKLGQADARKVYEQLVRDFADQAGPVAQARARLATLGRTATTAPTMPVVTAVPRIDEINNVQAMSPDGTKALFVQYDKGENLAVYDLATQRARLLTHFDWGGPSPSYGIWSPDGRHVAYMQTGASIAEVCVATLDGDSRVIFRNDANPRREAFPAAWLPDGRSLLVVLGRVDGTSAIGLVPIAGGTFTPLRSMRWDGTDWHRPRVSHDGRFVAFEEGVQGAQDVHVLSLDGRTASRITNHPADDFQPVWSPDGRHLIFLSTRAGDTALWAVAVKDGQAAGAPVRIKDGMRGVTLVGWTTRGLTYVDRLATLDIYTASVDRTTWQPAADPQLLPYPRTGHNMAPVWSPDGRSLAFISASPAEPDRRHLVVLPAVGGEPREYLIPTTRYNVRGPYDLRWFGDGSGLGFSRTDGQGQPAVFHLSLATGTWKTLPSPAKTSIRIEWNADGTRLFYVRQALAGESPGIIERDLATDRERTVYATGDKQGFFRGLRLSPDRRSLAFISSTIRDGHPTFTVMAVDVETGQARTLMEDSGGNTRETSVSLGVPAWAPDGQALIVPRTVGPKLWPEFTVVPLRGGDVRSFALSSSFTDRASIEGADYGSRISDPTWSADGTRMTFVLEVWRTNTWLMQNVLAPLELAKPARR